MLLKDIEQAAARLKGVIHKTPLTSSRTFSEMSDCELYLKCENMQKTGSFKVRGAYNKVAKMAQEGNLPAALIASSAGNHAQGVAYAAKSIGSKAIIVMPKSTPIAKVSATQGYGAEVILYGDCYDEAYAKAQELKEERQAVFIHPFDDEDVIAGQGTISLEILRALPTVDAIVIPAGGGGLLAGMASCIKQINPRIQVIGVQAENAPAIVQSFKAKSLVETLTSNTIADGIAVKCPGTKTLDLIWQYVDEMVTVNDDQIAEAILMVLERSKMVVEPAGISSLAAVWQNKIDLAGKRVVCLLSGGNIDVGFIHKVVEKGLINRGRQMKFNTLMPDKPGSLQEFATIVAELGANIILIQHDRLRANLNLGEAILHVACEVSSREHGQSVVKSLEERGYPITMES